MNLWYNVKKEICLGKKKTNKQYYNWSNTRFARSFN